MKKALISGITGQDGSYLAEYLLELGYEVHGMIRRVALEDPNHRCWRIRHILNDIHLHAASLESYPSIYHVLRKIMPDEIYHLAAQSFVSYSFEDEFSTMNSNINGTHYMLSAFKDVCPECHFYFAGSSEMFGKVEEIPQKETTKFHPRSVYGISKVAGYQLAINYREAYNLFTSTGILYNHESPRRGYEFVSRKITSHAAKIKLGLEKELRLGNVEAIRDWGFAGDYVKAMHAMLNFSVADDFVVCTEDTHSVTEFLDIAFKILDLNYKDYLVIDKRLYRPAEVDILVGDGNKARTFLKWSPTVKFEQLVKMMVRADYDFLKQSH